MAKRTYEFDIAAKVDSAISAINDLAEGAQSRLDKINFNTGVSAIRDGFLIIKDTAEFAFDAIKGFADAAIEESLEAEKAQQELANALRLSGDFSERAVGEFDSLATAISSVSTFTTDAVKSSVALAKQFRLTNTEAAKTVKVAADLAAVQGTTLEDATRKISQTMNGFVDKSLAKVIPGLKNLSKEALIAGDAVGLIAQRVQGSAEILGNTFAGAAFRAQEAANDIFEAFGNLVTQNPAIIAGINEVAKGFKEFADQIEANGDSLGKIVTDGFLLIVESAPLVIQALRAMDSTFATLSASAKSFILLTTNLPTALLQAVTGTTDALDSLKQRLAEINDAVKFSERDTAFYDPLIKKAEELTKRVRIATEAAEKQKKAFQNLGSSTSGVDNRLEDAFNPQEVRSKIEAAAKDPIRFAFEAAVKGQAIDAKQGAAIAAGITANIVKGAQGAQKLISAGIGAAADLLIPGIGGAVSEIVDVLAQGPEKTKQMVQEFARAIPQIITNIIDSLPVLWETIARELPAALAKTMPLVGVRFALSIVQNMPMIIKAFAQGLIDAVKQAGQALIDLIKEQFEGFANGLTGSGQSDSIFAGVPILQGVGDFFGFAEGGRVPDLSQFEGDRFPARLNAGEQVFSKDLTEDMENFLAQQEGGGGSPRVVQINLQVGMQQLASVMLDLDRLGYRTRVT